MIPSQVKGFLLIVAGFVAGVLVTLLVTGGSDSEDDQRESVGQATTFIQGEAGRSIDTNLDISDPALSFRNLRRIAEARVARSPSEAVEAAMKVTGYDNREAYFSAALQAWGEEDGQSAAEYCVANFKGEQMADALYYVAEGWAESDPPTAADWFHENADAEVREDALWEVLESWGRKDGEKAFQWALELDGDIRSEVIDGLAQGWAAVEPERAAEIGESLQGETYQNEFLMAVASHWSDRDPMAAAKWGESLLNEQARAGVFDEIGENWAYTAPAEAANWAAQLQDPENRRAMLSGAISSWSEHDPDAAMDFIAGVETDESHMSGMLKDVIYNWSSVDPSGTVGWLENQESGESKDNVLSVFSDVIMNIDSEAAVAWANQMSDTTDREAKLRRLIPLWIKKEGPVALRQLEQMDIPANLQEEFLKP